MCRFWVICGGDDVVFVVIIGVVVVKLVVICCCCVDMIKGDLVMPSMRLLLCGLGLPCVREWIVVVFCVDFATYNCCCSCC